MAQADHSLYGAYQDMQMIAGDPVLGDFFEQLHLSEATQQGKDQRKLMSRELDQELLSTGPWDMLTMADSAGRIVFSSRKDLIGKNIHMFKPSGSPDARVGLMLPRAQFSSGSSGPWLKPGSAERLFERGQAV